MREELQYLQGCDVGLHIPQVDRGILVKADLRVAAVIHGGRGQIPALLGTLHLLTMFLPWTVHPQS